ncbi:phosphohistidine phosphatase SixA [Tunicatimonas pelagia]|uniref:phosphohistidine phosphatase SixA n=1 Tax=Tunicatimonas pelagia TaxID=931531 RepID=UPI002666C740|nr:phosphohistidine phosphatase SixA [Tunicatimonas pelagia]WKN41993.1 phosphohistidine phosphatase SixA [Tunicatimonas pelagia]
MVKQLLLVRHGEAKDSQGQQADASRDLTARGYQDAVRVGNYLKEQGWQPDVIISSPAVRATATAQMVAEQLHYPAQQIDFRPGLYEASLRTFLAIINEQDNQLSRILAVGHNPTVSYLIEYLTGEEVGNVVPGGFALVEFAVESWSEVSQRTGSLAMYKPPTNIA